MKKSLLIIALTLVGFQFTSAQPDSAVRDGHLYLKVEDQSDTRLDSPPIPPNFQTLNIDTIWRPFTGLNSKLDRTYQLTFSGNTNTDNLISTLETLSYIQYAERVPLHFTQGFTPDDYDSEQYYLDKVEAKQAWEESKGSEDQVIAIVDNAVLLTHEDLSNNIWVNKDETPDNGVDDDLNGYTDDVNGYDVADDNSDPNPPNQRSKSFSHGTHVAGIASAETDNNKGIAGLGFNCHLMAIKCSPDSSDGNVLYNAYDGVYYAIQNNADVINMSWGGPNMTFTGSNIFETAQARNITCIASAGNASTNEKFYPAAYNQVMAIGATNQNDEVANYSNYGDWLTVMAPGTDIKSALAGSESAYGQLNGTSMSAPLVSGLAGLIKSDASGLSNQEVRSSIKDGADDISDQNPNFESDIGAGRINARKSLDGTPSLKPDEGSLEFFRLYPNPSLGKVQIRTKNAVSSPFDLTVLNSKGKVVTTESDFLVGNQHQKKLNMQGLNPGIYTVVLQNDQRIFRQQMMITQ